MSTLEKERAFFKANQAEWSKAYLGKFVLVKDDKLIGFFDNPEKAVSEGLRRFGAESFLVRGVDEKDETVRIPSLMFSFLNAYSTCPS